MTTASSSQAPLRVALLGGGVVGGSVARLLTTQADDLAQRIGRPLELVGIAVRRPGRDRSDLGLDPALVNPLGGAIAWGHPIGATGAIISARTVENLRASGRELGLATMCIGGGQAVASLWRAL